MTPAEIEATYTKHLGAPVRSHRGELVFFCPFHNDRRDPNLYVQLSGGKAGCYYCFACQAGGGMKGFLKEMGVAVDPSTTFPAKRTTSVRSAGASDPPSPPPVCHLTSSHLGWPWRMIEWLGKRGINMREAKRHGLQYALYQHQRPAVAIPYKDYWKLRFYERTEGFKFVTFPAGREPHLFVADPTILAEAETVLLCEGELDAIRASVEGFCAVSVPCGVGTWRDEWAEQLQGKRVAVCFDTDDQGVAGGVRVATILLSAGIRAVGTVELHGCCDWPRKNDLTTMLQSKCCGVNVLRDRIAAAFSFRRGL